MRTELKAQRKIEKLEALGVELTDEERETIFESFRKEKIEKNNIAKSRSREAESVLALMARQDLFTAKFCRECNGPFAINFADVAYCSDNCRAIALEKRGITWNPLKPPEERWGYRGPVYHDDNGKLHNEPYPAPLVVPPEALRVLANRPEVRKFFAEVFLEVKPTEQESDQVPVETLVEPQPEPEQVTQPEIAPEDALDALLG